MHRIDGPGATVDNRFTEGDPVGGVQATVVGDDWLNDVQEELMSVLDAASIAPVKGIQDQLLKAIRTLSGGALGTALNVKMSVPTASASATLTADQIVVGASLSGQTYRLASFNKTINLAAVGVGGMDIGTAPANGYVSIYAIYNPTTGVSALLACAQATSNGNVYSGANMPAGYTASALVSSWGTTAASLLRAGNQVGREVFFSGVSVLSTGTIAVALTLFSIAAAVPTNALTCAGVFGVSSTLSSSMGLVLAGSTTNFGVQNVNNNGTQVTASFKCPIVTSQQCFYQTANSAGTPLFQVQISSYTF